MSRELKFRAWQPMRKRFAIVSISGPVVFNIDDGSQFIEKGDTPDKWIFQQYTGLKDKNSVEIYEGDIVNCDAETDRPHTVIYSEEDAAFLVETRKADGSLGCQELFDDRGYEVIGNIYENPELLS